MSSLLAVFAHPDDESIACGGLLARCADAGARVSLLCTTRGEDAAPHDTGRRELAARRSGELSAAARVLGVSDVTLLDYPDGELEWLDPIRAAQLEQEIVAAIERTRPDVVITFDEDGLYWHPDHIALHHRATHAVQSLGERAPALFYVSMPPGAVRALVDAVGGHVLGIDNPDAFGALAPAPTLVVDVSAHAGRKLRALQCHGSQVSGGALERLDERGAARALGVEQFRRAAAGSTAPAFIEAFGQCT